jgi:hypothetical protein
VQDIVWNLLRVLFGLFVGTAAVVGFAVTRLSVVARALFGIASLLIVLPPAAFDGAHYVNLCGVVTGVALLGFDYVRRDPGKAALSR